MIPNMNMYMNQNLYNNMNNVVIPANNQNLNIGQTNQNINNSSTTQGDPNRLNLIFNSQGKKVTIQAQKDAKFCEVATNFANKAGVLGQQLTFILFSGSITKDCTKTLEELKVKNNNAIEVIYNSEVIGA